MSASECVQRVEIILTRSRDLGQAEIREAKGKWGFIFSLLVKVLLQTLHRRSSVPLTQAPCLSLPHGGDINLWYIVREVESMYIKQIYML